MNEEEFDLFDMSKLKNGEESIFENLTRFMETAEKSLNHAFGSEIYTPIGKYIISVAPNIIDGGWMVVISVKQKDREYRALVENSETREKAVEAHNYWVSTIVQNPPAILHDISSDTIITIEVPK